MLALCGGLQAASLLGLLRTTPVGTAGVDGARGKCESADLALVKPGKGEVDYEHHILVTSLLKPNYREREHSYTTVKIFLKTSVSTIKTTRMVRFCIIT